MRRLIAAGLAAAGLLAGCGGGDEPKTVTKDSYIAKADKVCADLSQRFSDAGGEDPQTPKDIVDSAGVLANLYDDLHKRLQDVKLPAGGAARAGAASYVEQVGTTQQLADQLRSSAQRLQDAVDTKDKSKITVAGTDVRTALDAFRAAQIQASRSGTAYGFTVCGSLN